MHNSLDLSNVTKYKGSKVMDRDGNSIGELVDIWLDENDSPAFASISTGFLGLKASFVPITGIHEKDDQLIVDYTKDKVIGSNSIDPNGDLDSDSALALYDYYNLNMTNKNTTNNNDDIDMTMNSSHSNDNHHSSSDNNVVDNSLTLTKDEVDVRKETKEKGRAVLRKYSEIEEKVIPVTTKEQKVRVVTEEIDSSNINESDLRNDTAEVVLHKEVPVVEKHKVPTQRVRLEVEEVEHREEVRARLEHDKVSMDEPGHSHDQKDLIENDGDRM